ncbi:intermembrane transport protein PqiB [Caulobacter sp. S45]|uniref:PqiB family protein n=1 Tax=Caulobacter sp. S45 TaxID=1641861 RepID=UPI001575E578|nr:MlaD family protein [Caulobacter sp. S45]
MSDTPPSRTADTAPTATARRTRWPGLVWALPLAALLIVAYLGLRALSDRGVDIVVTFASAAGARTGDTKVIYQGIEAGRVTRINLNRDGKRVDMTLRLIPRARAVLNSNTRFWMIGAKPSLTDIDSVKAALAGVTIGMAPGQGGQPQRRFNGLDQPPLIEPGAKGSAYTLVAHVLGSVRTGSALLYHGQEIGKVTSAKFTGLDAFNLGLFVYQPYDALVRPGAQFWTSSPLQVSLNGAGFSTSFAPADTVLTGAVDFDLPDSAEHMHPSPAGSTFVLYKTQGDAQQGLEGPQMLYSLYFKGAAGDLGNGSVIKLLGFVVGSVHDVELRFDPRDGQPYTAVTAAIYPRKLGLPDPAPGRNDSDAWRDATDGRLNHLLSLGYRARLTQSPPIIGGRAISLDPIKAGRGQLATGGPYPVIPSEAANSDIDDLTSQADQILRKVNAIPIEAIGQDVRGITDRLRAITASPALTDSLSHLDSTLSQVDQIMGEVKPQIGPLVTKLNQAADQVNGTAAAARSVLSGEGAGQDASLPGAIQQLTEAARSIRSLTDYLGRHPEALVKGKVKDSK